MNEYTDIREIHPGYTTIPCKSCGADVLVGRSVPMSVHEWVCDECDPEALEMKMKFGGRVTVNL